MPEVYIGNTANRFDDKGALTDKRSREFLQDFMTAYAEWSSATRSRPGSPSQSSIASLAEEEQSVS
jgi:hypothetical protein